MPSKLIDTVLEIAKAEIGVREIGNTNTGKRVQEYQAATTLGGTGWAWCGAYTSWCLKQAAAKLKTKIEYCYSASCDVILAWARSEGILHDTPQVGDIFLVMHSPHDASHTGLVTEIKGNRFREVSGNTNDTGSREGNGVYHQWRNNSSRYKFVRWVDVNKEAKPELWTVQIGEKGGIGNVPLVGGSVMVPVRDWGKVLGFTTTYNAEHQTILFDGREVPTQVRIIDGVGMLPVRTLADFSGLRLDVDSAVRTVTVTR